jgi:hypothetical protein
MDPHSDRLFGTNPQSDMLNSTDTQSDRLNGTDPHSDTNLSRNERVFEELEACQPVTTLLDNGFCILIIFLLRMHTTPSLTTTRERVSSQSTTDTEGTRWQNTAAAIYQTTSKRNNATEHLQRNYWQKFAHFLFGYQLLNWANIIPFSRAKWPMANPVVLSRSS